MSYAARTVVVASAALAVAAGVWLVAASRGQATVRVPAAPEPLRGRTLEKGTPIGMAGCMATACHGGSAEKTLAGQFDIDTWRSSGSSWVARDPHAGAYSLLTDKPPRAVFATAPEIMRRLGSNSAATDDARCLACHTNPTLAKSEPPLSNRVRALRSEGVSCEACHGNAGGWIREHTTWNGERRAVYAATGMAPLFDVGERAMTCLGCHIGAPADAARGYPARDMNHDMIAAGHPRLNFDFAEYHRRLPKHWQEKERTANGYREREGAFEVRLWLVGRVAHAEAACKLLEDRAERAKENDERTPWPEFAEFNCAACHHNIAEENRPKSGVLRWQMVWPVTYGGMPDQKEFQLLLAKMNEKRPASADMASRHAKPAAEELGKLRLSLCVRTDSEIVRDAVGYFPEVVSDRSDWDAAGQMLHGLAALERARVIDRPISPDFERAFGAMRRSNERDARRTVWPDAKAALDRLLAMPRPTSGPP